MRLALLDTALLSAALLLGACATPKTATDDARPTAPPGRTVPAPEEEDLNHAFQPDPEPTAAAAPPRVAAPTASARDTAESTARGLEHRLRDALAHKRLDDARAALAELSALAPALSGPSRVTALELAFRVESEAAPDAAVAAGWRWLSGCGPERVDSCRAAARTALQGLKGLSGPQQKKLAAQLADLAQAEQCPGKVERLGHSDACLLAAERTAAHHHDEWLAARLALAKAKTEKAGPRKLSALEQAAERCTLVQCALLRQQAFKHLAALADDAEGQARYGLLAMHAQAEVLPPEERLYARTDDVERPCARYEEKAGTGACRKLEKQLTGGYAFKDFSRASVGRALPPERVRAVNEHFQPLLQECLEAQARRMRPPDIARYELKWTVLNDGRVGEAHLRQDLDNTELARCVRAQFSAWRYPRYDGELEHVEQAFTISAVERRQP